MKDSGVEWIGEIPESWNVIPTKRKYTNLKEIVGDRVEEYERLSLTLNGVLKRPIDDSKGLQPKQLSTYQILYKNELIFKLIDLENIHTSRVGYSPYTGLVSPVYIRLNNSEESKYGFYYFTNMWYQEIFNYLGSGVRSNLTATNLLNVPYISVPKYEQQKIVNFLDKKTQMIDEIIADTKQSIVELKAYKQSIITEAVTKGPNTNVGMEDSGVEWIGEIPAGWTIRKNKYICNFNKGLNITKANLEETGIPVISYGQVHSKYPVHFDPNTDELPFISDAYLSNGKAILKKNDFIFADTSEDYQGSGNFSMLTSEATVMAGYHSVVVRIKEQIDWIKPEYLAYYYASDLHRNQVRINVSGIKVFSITQQLLKNTIILIPPRDIQNEIVRYIDEKTKSIDKLVKDKEQLISEYEDYKKSLIYEYVTGKKRVK